MMYLYTTQNDYKEKYKKGLAKKKKNCNKL